MTNPIREFLHFLGTIVFGYFAGRRGAGCSLLGAGCQLLSLILERQTCQLGLCFAHLVTID